MKLDFLSTRKLPLVQQFVWSIALVLAVAGLCYLSHDLLSYRLVAIVLLMTVSLLAMLFDILPVLIASALSALVWNFFFIPPVNTFHIGSTEDLLMFLLYFLVAMLNAVLTFKIREAEKKSRDQEEREKTIALYNTLLNSLSHELRTPIAAIFAAVDALREHYDRLNPVQRESILLEIDLASVRLNQQVENLLSMSRLESGTLKPHWDWCDVHELVHTTLLRIDHSRGEHVKVQMNDALPIVRIDRGLTEQVLNNLIYNACQYSIPEGSITIRISFRSDLLILEVCDQGPGFPEKEIAHVFDKFYRLPNTRPGGSGLGLSIVKGFVEAQGGQVNLYNNVSGGSTFVVRLPVEASFFESDES